VRPDRRACARVHSVMDRPPHERPTGEGERVAQAAIDNPIINSPYVEPARHFPTSSDETVTGEFEDRRRPGEFFVPVYPPKKRLGHLTMDKVGGHCASGRTRSTRSARPPLGIAVQMAMVIAVQPPDGVPA
jgi:hypothetical protein